jgi:hypothetical protein
MLVDGILDALFFASILSFIGMEMSPSEHAAVDSAGTEGGASSDTSSGSDTSGTDSTGSNASSADGGGGFDGFEGGGFDF